jgi:DNA-binding CsgD family transcriptional regulator
MRWSDKTLVGVTNLACAIAEAPLGDGSGAQIALEALSQLIPFDCAVLCRSDVSSLVPVAETGYRSTVDSSVGRAEYRHEQTSMGMDVSGAALRFGDLPGRGRDTSTVRELARPAGLRDGMGMSLRSRDGHFLGHIALNAATEGTFSEDDRDLLTFLNRPLGRAVIDRVPTVMPNAFGLTARELTVLDLIAQGMTNGEISDALMISQSTVRRHIEHVLAKLEVSSRTAAAIKASQNGLLGRDRVKNWSDDRLPHHS